MREFAERAEIERVSVVQTFEDAARFGDSVQIEQSRGKAARELRVIMPAPARRSVAQDSQRVVSESEPHVNGGCLLQDPVVRRELSQQRADD